MEKITVDMASLSVADAREYLEYETARLDSLERAAFLASKSQKRQIARAVKECNANMALLASVAYKIDDSTDAMNDDQLLAALLS